MTVSCLIIGYGSIGQRHARILKEMGHDVGIVSRRDEVGGYPDIKTALAARAGQSAVEYAVIASETSRHHDDLKALAEVGFDGTVLVEKPLFSAPATVPENRFRDIRVAYQLRFHPVIAALRVELAGETCLTADFRVGQHLSEWRPARDYRAVYSAQKAGGGGVLRDLSHELDLMLWLFGAWQQVDAKLLNTGTLGIDVEEVAEITAACEACPLVSAHLSYLDHAPVRQIRVTGSTKTVVADVIAGRLQVSGAPARTFTVHPDEAYKTMHAAMLGGGGELVCSLEDGLAVMGLIEAIEAKGGA